MQNYGYPLAITGGIASRIATLAILVLLPSHIGLREYGYFVLIITIGEIIEMTSSNWYRILLVRQGVNQAEHKETSTGNTDTRRFKISFAAIIIAMTAIALTGAIFLAPVFSPNHNSAQFTIAIAAYVFAFAFFKLLVAVLQAQKRQQLIGVLELFRGVLMSILVIAAITLQPPSFFYPALALSAAALAAAVAGLASAWRELPALMRQILKHNAFVSVGLPVIIATILTFQLGWFDRLIIQSQLGPETVGLYVAVAAIARQPIDLVLNALNTQTFPIMMERGELAARNAKQHAASILTSACILGVGGAAAIIALTNPLVAAVLPAFNGAQAAMLIAPIAIGSVCLGLKHFVFDNIFHAHGNNWLMLKWFAIISTASLLAAAGAIHWFGVIGAAFAFLGGCVFALISSAIVSRYIWTFPIPVLAIGKVCLAATMAALPIYALQTVLTVSPWLKLAIAGGFFALLYLAFLTLFLHFKPRDFMAAPWKLNVIAGATR